MKNTPWSFYYGACSENDTERDAFFYRNHEVIDRIGSEIRCFNIETGWDGVDTYDYTQIDKSVETLLKGYPNRYFVPRLQFNPPVGWIKRHPEELCVYYGGPKTKEEILNKIDTPAYDPWGADGGNKGGPGLFSGPRDRSGFSAAI